MNGIIRSLSAVALCFAVALGSGCSRQPPEGPNARTKELVRIGADLQFAKQEFNKGVAAYGAGKILDAATWFASAINRSREATSESDYPGSTVFRADAHFWYGIAMIDVYSLALKSSLEVIDTDGKKIGAKVSPEIAMSHVDLAISLNPPAPIYYWGKGYIYLKTGDNMNALNWFNSAIGRNTRDPNYYSYRALAYYQLARGSEPGRERTANLILAQEDCGRAFLLDQRHVHAYEVLVMIYVLGGQLEDAKQTIQKMDSLGLPTSHAIEIYRQGVGR